MSHDAIKETLLDTPESSQNPSAVDRERADLDLALSRLAPSAAPARESLERLMARVSSAPLRYAPFFGRTGALFNLNESQVEAQFARLADAREFKFAGWPGISQVVIPGGPGLETAETLFVKCAPGVRLPHHEHTGKESVLLLEGGYTEDSGAVFHAGMLHEMEAGTRHSIQAFAEEGCLFASVVRGRRFSTWPMRALAGILGR